jgi:hypothetical protein
MEVRARIAELASWDDAVLAQQFLELSQINPGLSPELTGFDMGEIDFRVESLDRSAPQRLDPADAIPCSGPAVTETDDLWAGWLAASRAIMEAAAARGRGEPE